MTEAGYNPKAIVELMQVLGARRVAVNPAVLQHPPQPDRIQRLQALISYPNGVPTNLESGRGPCLVSSFTR